VVERVEETFKRRGGDVKRERKLPVRPGTLEGIVLVTRQHGQGLCPCQKGDLFKGRSKSVGKKTGQDRVGMSYPDGSQTPQEEGGESKKMEQPKEDWDPCSLRIQEGKVGREKEGSLADRADDWGRGEKRQKLERGGDYFQRESGYRREGLYNKKPLGQGWLMSVAKKKGRSNVKKGERQVERRKGSIHTSKEGGKINQLRDKSGRNGCCERASLKEGP